MELILVCVIPRSGSTGLAKYYLNHQMLIMCMSLMMKKIIFLSLYSIEKDISGKCNMNKSYFFKKNKKEMEEKNIIIIKKKILLYFTFLFFFNNFHHHHHKGNRNIVKLVHSILALD